MGLAAMRNYYESSQKITDSTTQAMDQRTNGRRKTRFSGRITLT